MSSKNSQPHSLHAILGTALAVPLAILCLVASSSAAAQIVCSPSRTLTADVVAFDMPLMWNRLGPQNINGMMFALRRDVVNLSTGLPLTAGGVPTPGDVGLRPDKRPRPLVLRMGAGDCLTYTVTNLLTPLPNPFNALDPNPSPPVAGELRSLIPFNLNINDQVADRRVSLRFQGTQLVNNIAEDGSNVGQNGSSLVAQGTTSPPITIYAEKEGAFVGTSYGATTGGEGLGGNTANGLWAVLNVGPKGAAFYRAQVTREEMDLATTILTADGHPVLDYEKKYPDDCLGNNVWCEEGKTGLPVLNMVDVDNGNEIVHSDINALVVHGGADLAMDGDGHFPPSTYPLESEGFRNPTLPNRLEPFREITVAFHDEVTTKQAYPLWFEDPVLKHTLHSVRDSFMINYGSGGIGTEIISSRLRVGPMHDCVNCAYEEFFLTAFTVSDVGQLTDIPANFGLEDCAPNLNGCGETGPKANYALFPDDPSNVHHSYTGEFVKMRNIHAGPGEQHVFHQHNHQWLFNPNDDNSNYLDAQGIGPGAGYSYEFVNGGAGNRNKTAGDAIFHCHFYPHFAQGMWEMWRVHDVFEQGTALQTTVDGGGVHTSFVTNDIGLGDGTPAAGARALPDGEIVAGTPIPGVVPLPGKPMAPMPQAPVTVVANPNQVCVGPAPTFGLAAPVSTDPFNCPVGFSPRNTGSLAQVTRPESGDVGNPGYPFWIAGIEHSVGQRPPTPPLDMITQTQASALQSTGGPLWQHPGFDDPGAVHGWDGGLPRYSASGFSAGSEAIVSVLEPRLDLSKEMTKIKPNFYPEEGTDVEQAAMAYHAQRCHDTFYPNGGAAICTNTVGPPTGPGGTGGFILNGALPVPGAPYNEPCIDDGGFLLAGDPGNFFDGLGGTSVIGGSPFNAVTPRVYKAANVQIDAVFNKLGYHYPQERIITLWQDVVPSVLKQRPPEPFVLRMNTFDCTQYVHSNVVPKAFEVDDYQVRTPTDIIGQHIHLPKWDLTTADGAANGWNYEDGTLSPQMVVEIIEAINAYNTAAAPADQVTTDVEGNPVVASDGHSLTATGTLEPADHPFFGETPFALEWKGARSTMQRWFSDPVLNVQGVDRGLGIIFTHDHYGPSTHQQIGLYATVLVEPATSQWVHNETGVPLYTRTGPNPEDDGGPTSWQAAILPGELAGYTDNVGGAQVQSHREFYFEYSDFQHAYQPETYVGTDAEGFPLAEYTFVDSGIAIGGPGQTANAVLLAGQGALNPDPQAFRDAIQPSVRLQAPLVNGFPVDIWEFPEFCPNVVNGVQINDKPRPCPEAISADDPGMYVVNYRNESLAARVFDPNRVGPDGRLGTQAVAEDVNMDGVIDEFERVRGDLAHAMWSGDEGQPVQRAIAALNTKEGLAPSTYFDGVCDGGVFCPPINNLTNQREGDPFTPMARVFNGDRIHIKVQAGGHEEEHTKLLHGLKWLQAGAGFGEAKNSGWRNAQPGGISEQFSFRMPVNADVGQTGNRADYAYSMNNSTDGWGSGTWGIVRSESNNTGNLFELPDNAPKSLNITNRDQFVGVCPRDPGGGPTTPANLVSYDLTAVLAEDVLPVPGGVIVQDLFPGTHEGRAPDGGTLVYNSRPDPVAAGDVTAAGVGPLHDPTAILYFHTADLVFDPAGVRTAMGDPIGLQPGTAVEPLVLRANAGDCIEVTLRNALLAQAVDANGEPVFDAAGVPVFIEQGDPNALFTDQAGLVPAVAPISYDQMPDLATGNATTAMVRRDPGAAGVDGMTAYQTNLMKPSHYVGLHPALVEYDVTRADGVPVGQNNAGQNVAEPGKATNYLWYAGHLDANVISERRNRRDIEIVATPIEFGGFNLTAPDKIKQGQKGMLGAGVIYPTGSTFTVDAGTTTEATVIAPGGTFRDFTTVAQKGASMFYANSFPVPNILGEGTFGVAEDSQDMGQMAINYGTEPLWFRFGVNPTDDVAMLNLPNAGDAYSNGLVGGVDPETAVFDAAPGQAFRQHVLMPHGPGRGSTFDLHGHVWQRDPYVCPGSADLGLPGKCDMGNGHAGTAGTGEVGSQSLGDNPIGFGIGGIESWFAGEHYEIVIPSAGGGNAVAGDYLFRDHMGLGNAQGLWGIVRVDGTPIAPASSGDSGSGGSSGGSGGSGGKGKKKK